MSEQVNYAYEYGKLKYTVESSLSEVKKMQSFFDCDLSDKEILAMLKVYLDELSLKLEVA